MGGNKYARKHNNVIKNAVETMYRLSTDEAIREQCEAREDDYRLQRTIQKEIDQQIQYIQRTKQLFLYLAWDLRHEDMQHACIDDY